MLSDVLSCLQSILEGIRQSGILLSFYNNPALVTGILDDLEDGLEVNIAIAGNCECALADAFKEAPLVCTSLSYDAAAKVLEVDVTCAVNVFAQNLDGVDICIRAVAAVKEKEYIVGIYHIHEAVDLFLSLDNSAHVMMESKSHIHFLSNLTQFAEAGGQSLPLVVVHDIFAFQDGLSLAPGCCSSARKRR